MIAIDGESTDPQGVGLQRSFQLENHHNFREDLRLGNLLEKTFGFAAEVENFDSFFPTDPSW